VTERPDPCPSCGSAHVLPIRYGMPTAETEAAARRGEVVLGGCMIGRPGGDPTWSCRACGQEFGVMRWNRTFEQGEQMDDWETFEEKIDQAMCEVMLTDGWRDAPTLTMVLHGMLRHHAPPAIKKQAAPLLALLETPLAEMTDVQCIELSNELVALMRFVCHRGQDGDDA